MLILARSVSDPRLRGQKSVVGGLERGAALALACPPIASTAGSLPQKTKLFTIQVAWLDVAHRVHVDGEGFCLGKALARCTSEHLGHAMQAAAMAGDEPEKPPASDPMDLKSSGGILLRDLCLQRIQNGQVKEVLNFLQAHSRGQDNDQNLTLVQISARYHRLLREQQLGILAKNELDRASRGDFSIHPLRHRHVRSHPRRRRHPLRHAILRGHRRRRRRRLRLRVCEAIGQCSGCCGECVGDVWGECGLGIVNGDG